MRSTELDSILAAMLNTHPGISDLVFSVGRPCQVESYGELKEAHINPPIKRLTPFQTEQIPLNIIRGQRHLLRDLIVTVACDCSYAPGERARFRVSIFRHRGHYAIVMRKAHTEMPSSPRSASRPSSTKWRAKERSRPRHRRHRRCKTTTLTAILNEINETQPVHVVTLEDPIEFLHTPKRATFNQRELGAEFDDFPGGLRSALRQAPKVILVGEMRDRATVEIALTAAETGHLVLSTIHTINAGQAINRILGMFDLSEETQLRLRLSETMRYVVSQRLVPRIGGGRLLINEIMGSNLRTRETIALSETDGRSFYEIIETNATFGWTTFDQSLLRAYQASLITEETANLYATSKAKITRYIDLEKKERGLANDALTGLKLDLVAAHSLR